MAEILETQFASLGEERIAYQVFGQGPPVTRREFHDAIFLGWFASALPCLLDESSRPS